MPGSGGVRVRLIGILCWYDERVSWLSGVIASLERVGVSHLIAVDGAYAAYPNAHPVSGGEQHAAIYEVCRALDIGLTIHQPQEPWFGNEVGKRNYAFKLAETVAEEDDWYFLVDADHFVTSARTRVHLDYLEQTACDVGEVQFREKMDGSFDMGGCPLRCVFRAIPGLRFETNHFTYRVPDGRDLHDPTVEAVNLSMIEVEHRTQFRDPYRKEGQSTYYRRRDELGLELERVAS